MATDSSWAVDMNSSGISGEGDDQSFSGTSWQKLVPQRLLWDLNGAYSFPDYDMEEAVFTVPLDGVFVHDGQFRFGNLVNVKAIEIAIYQTIDMEASYWFVMDYQTVQANMDTVQLGNMIQCNFLEGQIYDLRVQLTPIDPESSCSADMLGSDDVTAWSCSWSHPLISAT